MIQPEVGDKLDFKPMYEDSYSKGTVDWVGSAQFAITSDDNPKHREIILFSEDRWKFINKKAPKPRTPKAKESLTEDEVEQENISDE